MHLELATWDHAHDIHDMILKFAQTTPYSHMEIDDAKVSDLIRTFIENPVDRIMVVAMDGKKPVGLIGATASETAFNHQRIACEAIWWVEPEYRKTRVAFEMTNAFEFWAKKVGCKVIQMSTVETDQVERIQKYYARRGLKLVERTFIKEI